MVEATPVQRMLASKSKKLPSCAADGGRSHLVDKKKEGPARTYRYQLAVGTPLVTGKLGRRCLRYLGI